jgi:Uma2 family endonuclease
LRTAPAELSVGVWAATLEKQAKRWTYEEYYKLEDDQRYEIRNRNLILVPTPDIRHQEWLGELSVLVRHYVRKKMLGRLLIGPVDVVLDNINTAQPDLVFVAAKNLEIIQRRAIFGTPDLLVEAVCPGSVRRDRYEKLELYARFGVKEYWIGGPANNSLEILALEKGRYELHSSAEEKGQLTSLVLTGLKFDLSEIGS